MARCKATTKNSGLCYFYMESFYTIICRYDQEHAGRGARIMPKHSEIFKTFKRIHRFSYKDEAQEACADIMKDFMCNNRTLYWIPFEVYDLCISNRYHSTLISTTSPRVIANGWKKVFKKYPEYKPFDIAHVSVEVIIDDVLMPITDQRKVEI